MSLATLDHETMASAAPASRGRVLLIAYSFPPVGGAGVQRPVKWTKYLRRAGWDVTVLTPANPSVPVLDESLLADVPADVSIVRPATWEPSYATKQGMNTGTRQSAWWRWPLQAAKSGVRTAAKLCLQPDPQILWYPNALRAATKLLSREPHDAILCTAPPYSSFLLGKTLKDRFHLPLILDYRDEWDLSSRYLEHAHRDGFSQFVQERQQRAVLRAADAVIATTQASVRRLSERLEQLDSTAERLCIYNGFDEDDFPASPPVVRADSSTTFRLVYTGTLWNLTDVSPLIQAMERLSVRSPELARRLEFICVGRKTGDQQQWLSRLAETQVRLIDRSYCDHSEVLQWLAAADALGLLLSDVPGAERVVPAKLFEYLAARREILSIVPDGETSEIVSQFFPQSCFSPGDVTEIADWLARRLQGDQQPTAPRNENALAEYSREHQTERLIGLLERHCHTSANRSRRP